MDRQDIVDLDIDSLEATKLLLLEQLELVFEMIKGRKSQIQTRKELEKTRKEVEKLREGVKNEERKKKI